MSLTIAHQSTKPELEARYTLHPYESSPRYSLPKPRLPSPYRADSPLGHVRTTDVLNSSLSSTSSRASYALADRNRMTTPHRGLAPLPPPSALTLPDPRSSHSNVGSLPAPSSHPYSGNQEESSKSWYSFKAEEERRKQEEERTRQETLKLEQRKIEASMLHDALNAGVPAGLVPMLLWRDAGNMNQEWMQQLVAQFQSLAAAYQNQQHEQQLQLQQQSHLQQLQQTQSHSLGSSPPEVRRDVRAGPPAPPPYQFTLPSQGHILASQSAESVIDPLHHRSTHREQQSHRQQQRPSGPLQTTFSAYESGSRHSVTPHSRSASNAQLPRLATSDSLMLSNQRQHHSSGPQNSSQARPDSVQATSPNILFHHWVPPNEMKAQQNSQSAGRGNTSAGVGSDDNPSQSAQQSEGDQREITPRKRKAQGGHQPIPPPSSADDRGARSPSFSAMSVTSATGPSTRSKHGGDNGNTHTELVRETERPKPAPAPTSAPLRTGKFRSDESIHRSSFHAEQDGVASDNRRDPFRISGRTSRSREPMPLRSNDDPEGDWSSRQQQRQQRYDGVDRNRMQLSRPRSR